ncbi:MFS transporter [Klebsiella pneumoniae]|uniref:MFS transporter n=1 Tax=Klebsiella pneumoniae TaxID=573 RepID=A0A377XS00_KLEPN|nr:MFS transporter [Klebsiella pneumoniae]
MWGVALFGIASLLCGMANSIGALLAARTLQGAGAALIVPQILATLHVTLKGPATPGPSACMAGSAESPLSSVRWAAAGWCRRTSPGWAGATPFLSMCRSACWCWL